MSQKFATALDKFDEVAHFDEADQTSVWKCLGVTESLPSGSTQVDARQSILSCEHWKRLKATPRKVDSAVHAIFRYRLLDILALVLGCPRHEMWTHIPHSLGEVEISSRICKVLYCFLYRDVQLISFPTSSWNPFAPGGQVWHNWTKSLKRLMRPLTSLVPSPMIYATSEIFPMLILKHGYWGMVSPPFCTLRTLRRTWSTTRSWWMSRCLHLEYLGLEWWVMSIVFSMRVLNNIIQGGLDFPSSDSDFLNVLQEYVLNFLLCHRTSWPSFFISIDRKCRHLGINITAPQLDRLGGGSTDDKGDLIQSIRQCFYVATAISPLLMFLPKKQGSESYRKDVLVAVSSCVHVQYSSLTASLH